MIHLDAQYSVDVREDGAGYVYELVNSFDEIVAEREGSVNTSGGKIKEIGLSMLDQYRREVEKTPSKKRTRTLVINIMDDTTDLQALNLVLSAVERGRGKGKAYAPRARYVYQNGVETFVSARKRSAQVDSFRVWKEGK